ncbi:hypothetical protein [Paludisphaera mucosa]|uniref:Uncharacterized protein n=1 Tax=Paludisphaera mucosa TaxID=3030827 RepID=A0ABT6FJD5_9BACT|nr:hypothetical protein [Paludisphaera mucosa]MDG3007687.1 hypothetical protein [Paludisphaera mucosa]
MPPAKSRTIGLVVLLAATATAAIARADDERWDGLGRELAEYRAQLDAVRRENGGVRKLPPVAFFLFGMGDRRKLVYKGGVLRDARTGEEVRRWDVQDERIAPSAYAVALKTMGGGRVFLVEDEEAVWLEEDGRKTALARGRVVLPTFAGRRRAAVLRVLRQELLINVVEGRPTPNFMVYPKPWYRDGAMMAMAFEKTGDLDLIRGWILGLREPYDRNNNGEDEADNLGEALYLISLVSDADHPLVPVVRRELKRFEKGRHIEGRSDFAPHPVYQTLWAKLGLASLGLDDPYEAPRTADGYAALAWWAPRTDDRLAQKVIESDAYPYLTWAGSHFTGSHRGKLGDRDYPLTWEADASQADYRGMNVVDPAYAEAKLCTPHTWHAAEALLDLLDREP